MSGAQTRADPSGGGAASGAYLGDLCIGQKLLNCALSLVLVADRVLLDGYWGRGDDNGGLEEAGAG